MTGILGAVGLPTARRHPTEPHPDLVAVPLGVGPDRLDRAVRATGDSPDTARLAAVVAVLARYSGSPHVAVTVYAGDRAPAVVTVHGPGDGAASALTWAQLTARVRSAAGTEPGPAGRTPVAVWTGGPPAGDRHDVVVTADEVRHDRTTVDATTARRFAGHLATVLDSAADHPDSPVSRLPLLTADEQYEQLVTWNDTRTTFVLPAETIHGCFTHRARQRPDDEAVRFDGGAATFGEVERRANQLAHHLRRLGVPHGGHVGVCLPRSPEFLVAALAVMKAGAAYLPLDPGYPAARIRTMLADAGCAALVTLAGLTGLAGAGTDHPVVLLDEHADLIGRQAGDQAPAVDVDPDDLCYLIYTSGSTGRPKGIQLRHRGVLNNLADLNQRFGVGPGDGVLALSSLSFDMSVYEFLGVTIAGGRVVVPAPDRARDPGEWLSLFTRYGLTLWNSAPSLLDLAVTQAERTGLRLPRLRLVLGGGDWIPVSLPDRVRALAPDVRFVSLGGATEASIHSTVFEVSRVDPGWASIPYGRPMANQRTYVLDPAGQPVPIGVAGELHLAGTGLARGYVGEPGLTTARFFEWSSGPVTAERLYRTGDLARYDEDGLLELLGRMDFQVKIHGVRIEVGEVEAALRTHPRVRAATVGATGTAGDERQLVAYVVTVHGRVPVEQLRQHVAALLPASMVPAVITVLAELPLTPNGKVDRSALEALDPISTADATAPRTGEDEPVGEWEELVAAVWGEVLGEPVGRNTNFFTAGGDSFLAMRAAQLIDPDLPVAELYAGLTVRGLARRLAERPRPAAA